MRLLLVTTSGNAVRRVLQNYPDIELSVIDCELYLCNSIKELKTSILSELNDYFVKNGAPEILLTYRCPIIIPKEYYSKVFFGAFNIHPSLLPKYSGLNPWEEIFRNGEHTSGITIHRLTDSPDCGDIIMQNSFPIDPNGTITSAREKADHIAANMVFDFLQGIPLQSAKKASSFSQI